MKKKLVRLCTLCLLWMCCGIAQAQTYADEAISVLWEMNDPANYTKSVVSPEGVFNTVDVNLGDVRLMDQDGNENATGTSNVSSGVTFSQMRPTNSASDYVTWSVKPMAGLTFTPKKITAYIVRFGTDAEHGVVISARIGTDTPVTLGTYTAPRNNKSKADDKYGTNSDYVENGLVEINLTDEQQAALTSSETFSLMGTIGVGNTKAGGIAKVTITGVVNGTIKKYTTVYNIAQYLFENDKVYEGNTGTIPATTVESGANAFDMKVDATSGKLGKNNADWAQFNKGTVLTIPGVPQGAKVGFTLYNDTKVTIAGVAYGNGDTYTATKDINLKMSNETSNGYIQKITVDGTAFVDVLDTDGYSTIWQFGKSNGAPEFALEKSAEYTYTNEDGRSLIINTSAGKLNNASRSDQWAQCNDGTRMKVPVYEGSKVSWGKYSGGDQTGFTIDGILYNDYYVATEETTVEMTAKGVSYISNIKIEPEPLYEVTGTITGGTVDNASIIFTANGNGQSYTAKIASSAFTIKVPAGSYTLDLSDDVAYVVSTPESVTISESNTNAGVVTIIAASPQAVTGQIKNAPAEAFTLTFTGNSSAHKKEVACAANATSYTVSLDPDTYTMTSSVGTLSTLSTKSFKILKETVTHNIYFPEVIPAATQSNITVDNTATVAANVYHSVSDALAAAKAGNIAKPVITLTSGQTFKEQVKVDMAGVTLKTSGEEPATITWYYGIGYCYYSLDASGYYNKDRAMTRNDMLQVHPARWGATVLVTKNGTNFKAENIIFENSFNQRYTEEEVADGVKAVPMGDTKITYDRTLTEGATGYFAADTKEVTERAAAIGFENAPKGCQLYKCKFIGSQDTFYSSGTLYVKDCDIQGNTDYIFGGGQVVFDNCNLVIGGYSDKNTSAYITAQKGNAGEAYIFRNCTVKAADRQYVLANLGRDWGGAAATVYYLNLKNEIGDKLKYKWTNMGGGVTAGTANLHIYDFDPAVNANYSTTGKDGANINGLLSDDEALNLYANVVARLGFTPERIYEDKVVLDENSAYNICRIAASNNIKRNVSLTRALPANDWTPIVLPFALTAEQISTTFGSTSKVAALTSGDEAKMEFTTVTSMEANKPYLINVTTDFTAADINDVTVVKAAPKETIGGWSANGTYVAEKVPVTNYYFDNNQIKKATDATKDIKAFSAYYSNATANDVVSFTIDGNATGIQKINAALNDEGHLSTYNLNGQRVDSSYKGVVIVNGKKVVIK